MWLSTNQCQEINTLWVEYVFRRSLSNNSLNRKLSRVQGCSSLVKSSYKKKCTKPSPLLGICNELLWKDRKQQQHQTLQKPLWKQNKWGLPLTKQKTNKNLEFNPEIFVSVGCLFIGWWVGLPILVSNSLAPAILQAQPPGWLRLQECSATGPALSSAKQHWV